jgi:hypothetical protein
MRPQRFSIVAINKGSMTTCSLDEHMEVLIRLFLHLFAKDPEHFGKKNLTLDSASTPGFMRIGPQYLLSSELCKIMSKKRRIRDTLSNISNHMKTKVNDKCTFTNTFQRKIFTTEFKENLRNCLDMDIPLRIYQMEQMVERLDDGYIKMTSPPVASRDRHRTFVKESSMKYMYKSNVSKTSFYLYSFFEAICYQCGFFTWEDISKYLTVCICLYNLLFLLFRC